MKAEIKIWLKMKELDFSQKDNINPELTPRKYLDKHVFSDLHEVFLCVFLHFLQEWLLRLKDNHPTNQIRQLEWNPMEIVELQQVNNKFKRTIDFQLDNIVVGFITKFAVDIAKSYTVTDKYFLKGPRGRHIRSLYTSINILLYDNDVITMESNN